MLARHLRDEKRRDLRRVGERLVIHLGQARDHRQRVLGRDVELGVVGAEMRGDRLRMLRPRYSASRGSRSRSCAPCRVLFACISATTADESMPPERNAPSGTSAIMRRLTASPSSASSASTASSSLPTKRALCPSRAICSSVQIRPDLRRGAGAHDEDRAGRQLVDAPIDRLRPRHVHEAQEGGECVAIERRLPAGMRAQRLELGAEQQQLAELRPIERLDAEPVAHEVEHAVAPVPQRHGEHADEALGRRPRRPIRRRPSTITSVSLWPRNLRPRASSSGRSRRSCRPRH